MTEVVEQLRAAGLAMGGRYPASEVHTQDEAGEDVRYVYQRFVSWTTDEAKADAARELGATVTSYQAHDPSFSGWEVSVNVDVTDAA